ncbi:MAG: phytanoyl-CoA dioxygenase family protein [Corynebacteriales bacterium]|nr:phytanoyl-CoA dioxygenase family protein [Mycobacteriales bacterium]
MTLSERELETFARDGYVVIRGAVDRATIDDCRAQLSDLLDESPDDTTSWTEPVRRVDSPMTPSFAAAARAPALTEAYDQLVGRGRWTQRIELGNVAIRFPTGTDAGDTGWHIDASYLPPGASRYFVNVSSRDRGLLMLFLLSDVGDDDAPTRIRAGSHLDVPRHLLPYGDTGIDMFDLAGALDTIGSRETPERREVLATGAAGDVFLCHPFLVHAAQRHRGTRPRFMSQPGLMLTEQFDLDHPRSPVERTIAVALAQH